MTPQCIGIAQIYAIFRLWASRGRASFRRARGTADHGGTAMIVGLGIDMTELARIRAAHARFGRRFLEKFLAPGELAALAPHPPIAFLAGRFAAKEAASKALGTGFRQGVGPCQIEVLPLPAGGTDLIFHGGASERARLLGTRAAHLSISHERSHAVAVVVLEG